MFKLYFNCTQLLMCQLSVVPRTFPLRRYRAPRIDTSHRISHFTTSQTRTSYFTPARKPVYSYSIVCTHRSVGGIRRTLTPLSKLSFSMFVWQFALKLQQISYENIHIFPQPRMFTCHQPPPTLRQAGSHKFN